MQKTVLKVLAVVIMVAVGFIHWFLPGLVEKSMNVVTPHPAYQIRPEVAQFHDSLFVADLHTDSLLWKRNLLERSDIGHIEPVSATGDHVSQRTSAPWFPWARAPTTR